MRSRKKSLQLGLNGVLRRCNRRTKSIVELGLKWTGFTRGRGIGDDGGVVLNEGLQGFLVGIEWG